MYKRKFSILFDFVATAENVGRSSHERNYDVYADLSPQPFPPNNNHYRWFLRQNKCHFFPVVSADKRRSLSKSYRQNKRLVYVRRNIKKANDRTSKKNNQNNSQSPSSLYEPRKYKGWNMIVKRSNAARIRVVCHACRRLRNRGFWPIDLDWRRPYHSFLSCPQLRLLSFLPLLTLS